MLHLPRGGSLFACRLCHGLRYACQREGQRARLERRSRKLYWRAGSTSCGAEFTPKPKGMHWETFNRLMDQAALLSEAAFFSDPFIRRLLARSPC